MPLPLAPGGAPDALAPGGAPWNPALPAVPAFTSPVYVGTAVAGTQLFYSSAQFQTTLAADYGATILINSVTGLPQGYPFKLLLEWGTPSQEIAIVTSAPQGNGPYTFTSVLRGCDGGGLQIVHAPGAQVSHGVSAADFYDIRPVFNVCSAQFAGGADPTGMLDSSPAFQAAVNTAGTSVWGPSGIALGGTVIMPPGTYMLKSGLVVPQYVSMLGDDITSVSLSYLGPGVAILAQGAGPGSPSQFSGRFSGFTLSGYGINNVTGQPTAIGFKYDSIQAVRIDNVAINGFGNIGLYGCNVSGGWSEQCSIDVRIIQCGTAAVFDTGSFDYSNFNFLIISGPGQGGVTLQNGANLQGVNLRMRGDFFGAPSVNNAAVLAIDPGNLNGTSFITNSVCDIAVESQGTGVAPYTIVMGSSNSASQFQCTGALTFKNSVLTFQGFQNPHYMPFGFSGLITDTNLGLMDGGDGLAVVGGTNWGAGNVALAGNLYLGNVYFQFGDVVGFQLANGNTTLTFNGMNAACRRTEMFIAQPASGAAGTITWPGNITWAGGITPVLSTASSAVDRAILTYLPGTTHWYGAFFPAAAIPDTEQFACLASAYTLAANTNAQPLFNATTLGALTVSAATSYFFEAEFDITGLSASTHTLQLTFGGTATYTSVKYMADVLSPFTAGTYTAWPSALFTAATVQTLVAAGTNTSAAVRLKGILRINAAGTVIPQVTQLTAGAAAVVSANSWIRLWPVGSNTAASAGNWS